MALSDAYFDSIQLDLVKWKYYNASSVNAVLSEIRRQARELRQENEELRQQLQKKESDEKDLLSAQKLYREVLTRAEERADGIVKEAEEKSRQILDGGAGKAERLTRFAEDCLTELRDREEQTLDYLNSQIELLRMEKDGQETEQPLPESSLPAFSYADLEKRVSSLALEIDRLESE